MRAGIAVVLLREIAAIFRQSNIGLRNGEAGFIRCGRGVNERPDVDRGRRIRLQVSAKPKRRQGDEKNCE